tara:strand:- start:1315 stop:1956 length:642 start_codon:yes stop_codon:yes gene_type:complete
MSDKKYNQFHSNYLEDKWISENLILSEKGFFVDVGACDAIKRSNTYHFEMNGWDGICMEPDKFYFEDNTDQEGPNNPLPKFRKTCINSAISDYDGELEFISRGRKCLSQVWMGEESVLHHTVKCSKLETILQEYDVKTIDIMDISCRGYDWKVWNSFEYEKYKPKVIITEYNSRGYDKDLRVTDFLINTGEYSIGFSSEVDNIIVHKDVKYKE